ncbi:MAG: HWE histidine kinase domain-containing protein [Allosphingosinicella sp.]|uniref:PAS domain-containing sensor histidine kinase n=1 Tax=Allosphingosinicella sp. TaxID=2823234 RepID=UPI003931A199
MAPILPQGDDGETPGMSLRIRGFDWAATPIGPISQWPERLRFAVSLLERSPAPMAVYWGPELTIIFNDAWAERIGDRPPGQLGQTAREAWQDLWGLLGPQFDHVRATGEGLSIREQMVPLMRGGLIEETWWSYSLVPIVGDAGEVEGIMGLRQEITKTVAAERRMAFQVRLADHLRSAAEPSEVKAAATELLGRYLDVARVGYAELDPEEKMLTVRRDWTRDPSVPSLVGQRAPVDSFGPGAIELLRAGEAIPVADYRAFPEASDPEHSVNWDAIGVRALIVVPLVRLGRVRAILYVHESSPRQWKRAEIAIARDVAERTWAAVERAQAERSLRDSEDHYRHVVELNPQVSWTALPDGQLNRVARRWREWTGTDGTGDSWAEGLHPEDRARTFEAWARSVASGEPYDIEHRVLQTDGGVRWCRSRAFPRRDEDGNICLWYGTTEDIHERKVAEDHQRLLINELNHRVKNTLATVQAIAFQTLKGDIPLEEARARFEARLQALSRAHNMLTERNWEGAPLERVVADATEYLAGERARFEVAGDPIWLAPRAALALSLALHELGTNAAKYGALSAEGGRVSIRWSTGEGRLRLVWKESGGPPVVAPARRGFGSRLIERGLQSDLGGAATMLFDADGLRCEIDASLEAAQAVEPERG